MHEPRAARPADVSLSKLLPSSLFEALAGGPAEARPRLWLALALSGLLAGCAAQSPPQPPRLEHPEKINDLRVEQIGHRLEISFTLPALATDGERLTKPLEAEIFRSIVSTGQSSPAPSPAAGPWAVLSREQVRRDTRGPELVYQAGLSDQEFGALLNSRLDFHALTLTRGFRNRPLSSGPSNLASITVLDVSGPVAAPSVETTEKALVVRWAAPRETLSGKPVSNLTGYRVYTSPSGEAGTFELLGESQAPEFLDRDFQFGRHYYFKVRAVFSANGATAESQDSAIAEVIPRDTFPPQVPLGLSAITAAGAVELVWHPDSEPDLAGYRVYRREQDSPFQLLNKDVLRTPVYRDTGIAAGRKYLYAVTAVDLSGNESSKSAEVSVITP